MLETGLTTWFWLLVQAKAIVTSCLGTNGVCREACHIQPGRRDLGGLGQTGSYTGKTPWGFRDTGRTAAVGAPGVSGRRDVSTGETRLGFQNAQRIATVDGAGVCRLYDGL